MPQFNAWLESQRYQHTESPIGEDDNTQLRAILSANSSTPLDDSLTPVGTLLEVLDIEKWTEDSKLAEVLKPILLRVGARYIYQEKKRGKALCPVANFHIRNGAIFERINWLADCTPKVIPAYIDHDLSSQTTQLADFCLTQYLY